MPGPWKRRFQCQFGNPGGALMARLPGWTVLETTGRRTGSPRRVPIGARLIGECVWIVAVDPAQAGYVRNIEADSRVRVMMQGAWRAGTAQLLSDDNSRRRMFQINPLNGLFIAIAGREYLTIRVDLADGRSR
ncbi:MAG: nitroreductase/quinone reductase family protein [Acidimicrobiales bacterium]